MNKIILHLHIISSIIPSILTLIIIYKSIIGLSKNKSISLINIKLPFYVVIFLYFQLFLGILLFLIHINDYSIIENVDQATSLINRRFWALEHFIMMFFALILSHIAYSYSKNLKNSNVFFKKSLLFFGLVFVLISTSLIINAMKYSGIWNL